LAFIDSVRFKTIYDPLIYKFIYYVLFNKYFRAHSRLNIGMHRPTKVCEWYSLFKVNLLRGAVQGYQISLTHYL